MDNNFPTDYTEVKLTDHEFAAWLRRRKAIDYFKIHLEGAYNEWFTSDERLPSERVALEFYDNARCTRRTFLRNDLCGREESKS